MNSIYLVDYVNVGEKGLDGISDLHETDKVYIYYNDVHARGTIDTINALKSTPAKVELIDTGLFGGMLETQLSSAFGQFLHSEGTEAVFVVSLRRTLNSLCYIGDSTGARYGIKRSIRACSLPKGTSENDDK